MSQRKYNSYNVTVKYYELIKGEYFMLEIFEFIFQDFWHWLGTLILLGVIAEGVGGMFRKTIIKSDKRD